MPSLMKSYLRARRDRVGLRDFGTFVGKVGAAHVGRNPKTGVEVQVPEKVKPAFKPGKKIRKRVNSPMAEPSPTK
jgi:integration host factor subunit beta